METKQCKRGRSDDDPFMEVVKPKRAATAAVVSYRLLCPATKIGNVIGKGGAVISQLRGETGARIKIQHELPGCPDRLIHVSSHDEAEQALCRAQKALLALHGRLLDNDEPHSQEGCCMVRMLVDAAQVGAVLGRGGEAVSEVRRSSGAHVRVSDQRNNPAEMPSFAARDDALITVKGEAEQVKDALRQIAALVREHMRRNPSQRAPTISITAVATSAMQRAPPPPGLAQGGGAQVHHGAFPPHTLGERLPQPLPPQGAALRSDNLPPHIASEAARVEVAYRLLVPASHIGGVIGRRGDVIQAIRDATGARIRVHDSAPERKGADRVISISSREVACSSVSPAQEALALLSLCLLEPKGCPPVPVLRTLLPATQVGGALGKGGAAINRVRSGTHANVRIVPLEPEEERALPKEVSGQAYMVLSVEGTVSNSLAAIRAMATILRSAQADYQGVKLPCSLPSQSGSPAGCAPSCWPQPPLGPPPSAAALLHRLADTRLGMRALPPDLAPVLAPRDATRFSPPDVLLQGSPIRRGGHRLGNSQPLPLPSSRAEYLARELGRELYGSPRDLYGSPMRQGSPLVERLHALEQPLPGQFGHNEHQEFGGRPFADGRACAPEAGGGEAVRELHLAGAQVGCVLGKAGDNISQIRKISGARVKLSDAPRGVTERTLRLAGAPEQVQAAVNLVQAFLLAGRAGSRDAPQPLHLC